MARAPDLWHSHPNPIPRKAGERAARAGDACRRFRHPPKRSATLRCKVLREEKKTPSAPPPSRSVRVPRPSTNERTSIVRVRFPGTASGLAGALLCRRAKPLAFARLSAALRAPRFAASVDVPAPRFRAGARRRVLAGGPGPSRQLVGPGSQASAASRAV